MCGPGTRSRSVFCGELGEDGRISKSNASNCIEERKYNETEDCVGEGVCAGTWFSGPWGEVCTGLCIISYTHEPCFF